MPPRKKWINFGNWKSFEASFMNLMRNLCLFTFSSCGKKPLSFLSVHVDTNYQEFIKEFLLVFLCDYWEIVIVVDFAILGPCFLINPENQVFWFLCAKSIAEFYKEKNWCGPSLRPLPAWYSTVVCLPFLSFSLTKLLHPWVTCQPCYACSSPFRSTGTRKLISAQTHYAIKLSLTEPSRRPYSRSSSYLMAPGESVGFRLSCEWEAENWSPKHAGHVIPLTAGGQSCWIVPALEIFSVIEICVLWIPSEIVHKIWHSKIEILASQMTLREHYEWEKKHAWRTS